MNQEDKPTFWEKLLVFVLVCAAVAGAFSLVKLGLIGLMGVCK